MEVTLGRGKEISKRVGAAGAEQRTVLSGETRVEGTNPISSGGRSLHLERSGITRYALVHGGRSGW